MIWTPKDRTTSQRCQYYNRTSLIRIPKDTSKCPHDREVCFTVKSPDTDTKETDSSVCVTEVSALQSNLLNMDTWQNQVSTSQRCLYYNRTSWYRHQWDRAKCPHHRGVCFTVGPPDTDTKGAEPSVHITEVSVLESSLVIQIPMRQSQVSALQRSLFTSQTSWYRHQCDRAKCLHYRGVYYGQISLIRTLKDAIKCSHHGGVEEWIVWSFESLGLRNMSVINMCPYCRIFHKDRCDCIHVRIL